MRNYHFACGGEFVDVDAVFAADEQAAETDDFVHGFAEPLFGCIEEAGVFVNRWHERSCVDVGVADSADENGGRGDA